jgi:hypothetical protein
MGTLHAPQLPKAAIFDLQTKIAAFGSARFIVIIGCIVFTAI